MWEGPPRPLNNINMKACVVGSLIFPSGNYLMSSSAGIDILYHSVLYQLLVRLRNKILFVISIFRVRKFFAYRTGTWTNISDVWAVLAKTDPIRSLQQCFRTNELCWHCFINVETYTLHSSSDNNWISSSSGWNIQLSLLRASRVLVTFMYRSGVRLE